MNGMMVKVLLLIIGLVAWSAGFVPPPSNQRHHQLRHNELADENCDQQNLPPTATDTTERLEDLRSEMNTKGYSAYIIPSQDAHLSEYINPADKKREWISGFSGSAGTAVVTSNKAALWTDGRYFDQAPRELDCNWILMKTGQPNVPTLADWLMNELNENDQVAANPFLFAISEWQSYENYFQMKPLVLVESNPDLIDLIWLDPPELSDEKVILYPTKYAGITYKEKVEKIRTSMMKEKCEYLLLTRLDDTAWTFNLRGGDIPHTPVFTSYAIISQSENSKIFVDLSKLDEGVNESFNQAGCENTKTCVQFLPYEEAQQHLEAAGNNAQNSSFVWMPGDSTSYGMYSTVPVDLQVSIESIIPLEKGTKNPTEVEAMLKAHVVDGLALCEYFKWLEENVKLGGVDEINGADKLQQIRENQPLNKGISFGSISASGPNGAIIHYGATPETNRNLTTDELYMIDSGGQYFEGTTDVTRTMHFGQPRDFEKEMFTRALMGLIDAEDAMLKHGTVGNDVDILVRRYIWEAGYDFNHGTGHGIGQYLCIHEYPPGVGVGGTRGEIILEPGMFVSLEPGYYETGNFGLRHENIVHVVDTGKEFEGRKFYQLQPATLAPFQLKMINVTMMSQQQVDYLNSYHQKILDIVGSEAKEQNKRDLYKWIVEATKPIIKSSSTKSSTTTINKSSFLLITVSLLIHILFRVLS